MLRRKVLALALCLPSSYALTPNLGEGISTQASRRAFLGTSAVAFLGSFPAFADDDISDLSMPANDQKSEEEAMKERLRRKAELQKKASKPKSFTDNLAAEKKKKEELKMSKEERRNALCEELGRGC